MSSRSSQSVARLLFQLEAGPRHDRTWLRVLDRLEIRGKEDDPDVFPLVKAYAYLRKVNRNQLITLEDCQQFLFVQQNLPQFTCTGRDLLEAIGRLEPTPAIETVYRWGYSIGVSFGMDRWYSEDDVRVWVLKIASQTRFRFPTNQLKKVK